MRKEKNTYFVKIKQKRLEKYYNMCYNYFHNKQIKEYYGKGEKNMTFEAFQSYIKENVLKEWREDADIEMAVVRKNNGIELCGLYIRREEEQISPTIYLDEYYSYYLKGEALEEIITRIWEEYEWKISRVADYHFNLEKFEYVRDRIVYRLVNYEKNKEILEDCPHLRLYDLALTFRWVAHSDDIGISTALVTNQELQVWGISMNELLLAARENTPRLFPVHMIDMDEMIAQAGIPISLDESAIPMYIMTNEQEVNGASVLLYDNVLESFALEKKTDFYILPSSIHEVILVPSNKIDDPSALFTMVSDANNTVVALGDILSDSVYYYNRRKNQIVPVGKERKIV